MKLFKKLWSLARRVVGRVRQSQLVHELREVGASHGRELIRSAALVVDDRIRRNLPAQMVPIYDVTIGVILYQLRGDRLASCLAPPRAWPQGAI